jgi:hypothetical protein
VKAFSICPKLLINAMVFVLGPKADKKGFTIEFGKSQFATLGANVPAFISYVLTSMF